MESSWGLVALPSKRQAVIYVGKVEGDYRYEQDNPTIVM